MRTIQEIKVNNLIIKSNENASKIFHCFQAVSFNKQILVHMSWPYIIELILTFLRGFYKPELCVSYTTIVACDLTICISLLWYELGLTDIQDKFAWAYLFKTKYTISNPSRQNWWTNKFQLKGKLAGAEEYGQRRGKRIIIHQNMYATIMLAELLGIEAAAQYAFTEHDHGFKFEAWIPHHAELYHQEVDSKLL